jgi:hypothetical protein
MFIRKIFNFLNLTHNKDSQLGPLLFHIIFFKERYTKKREKFSIIYYIFLWFPKKYNCGCNVYL